MAEPWLSPQSHTHGLQDKTYLLGQDVAPKSQPRPQESSVCYKQRERPVLLPTAPLHSGVLGLVLPARDPKRPVPTLQRGNLRPGFRGARVQTLPPMIRQHPGVGLTAARKPQRGDLGVWGEHGLCRKTLPVPTPAPPPPRSCVK